MGFLDDLLGSGEDLLTSTFDPLTGWLGRPISGAARSALDIASSLDPTTYLMEKAGFDEAAANRKKAEEEGKALLDKYLGGGFGEKMFVEPFREGMEAQFPEVPQEVTAKTDPWSSFRAAVYPQVLPGDVGETTYEPELTSMGFLPKGRPTTPEDVASRVEESKQLGGGVEKLTQFVNPEMLAIPAMPAVAAASVFGPGMAKSSFEEFSQGNWGAGLADLLGLAGLGTHTVREVGRGIGAKPISSEVKQTERVTEPVREPVREPIPEAASPANADYERIMKEFDEQAARGEFDLSTTLEKEKLAAEATQREADYDTRLQNMTQGLLDRSKPAIQRILGKDPELGGEGLRHIEAVITDIPGGTPAYYLDGKMYIDRNFAKNTKPKDLVKTVVHEITHEADPHNFGTIRPGESPLTGESGRGFVETSEGQFIELDPKYTDPNLHTREAMEVRGRSGVREEHNILGNEDALLHDPDFITQLNAYEGNVGNLLSERFRDQRGLPELPNPVELRSAPTRPGMEEISAPKSVDIERNALEQYAREQDARVKEASVKFQSAKTEAERSVASKEFQQAKAERDRVQNRITQLGGGKVVSEAVTEAKPTPKPEPTKVEEVTETPPSERVVSAPANNLRRLLEGTGLTRFNINNLTEALKAKGLDVPPELKAQLPELVKELKDRGWVNEKIGGTYTLLTAPPKMLKGVSGGKISDVTNLRGSLEESLKALGAEEPTRKAIPANVSEPVVEVIPGKTRAQKEVRRELTSDKEATEEFMAEGGGIELDAHEDPIFKKQAESDYKAEREYQAYEHSDGTKVYVNEAGEGIVVEKGKPAVTVKVKPGGWDRMRLEAIDNARTGDITTIDITTKPTPTSTIRPGQFHFDETGRKWEIRRVEGDQVTVTSGRGGGERTQVLSKNDILAKRGIMPEVPPERAAPKPESTPEDIDIDLSSLEEGGGKVEPPNLADKMKEKLTPDELQAIAKLFGGEKKRKGTSETPQEVLDAQKAALRGLVEREKKGGEGLPPTEEIGEGGPQKNFDVTLSDGTTHKVRANSPEEARTKAEEVLTQYQSSKTVDKVEPSLTTLEKAAKYEIEPVKEAGAQISEQVTEGKAEAKAQAKATGEQLKYQEQLRKEQVRETKQLQKTEDKELTQLAKQEAAIRRAQTKEKFAEKPFTVGLSNGRVVTIRARNENIAREIVQSAIKKNKSTVTVQGVAPKPSALDEAITGAARKAEETGFLQNPVVRVLNAVKSITFGGDVGHLLRQGKQMNADLLFSKHAKKVWDQVPALWKLAKGGMKELERLNERLYSDKDIKMMVDDFGMDMPGMGKGLKEEAFHGAGLAEKLPVIGKHYVERSEAVYTGGLNFLRAAEAKKWIEKLRKDGFTPENAPEKYNAVARAVNIISQRGSFSPAYQKLFSDASAIYGAPRAKAARLQNAIELFRGGESGRVVRTTAAKTLAFNMGIYGLLAATTGAKFIDDPEASDFGKIRINDKITVDPWMGLGVTARTVAKLVTGKGKSPYTGKEYPVTPSDALMAEFLGGIAPGVKLAWEAMSGKDLRGYQVDRLESLLNVAPLTAKSIQELFKEGDIDEAIELSILQFMGEGVDVFNYEESKAKQARLRAERGLSTGKRGGKRKRTYAFD